MQESQEVPIYEYQCQECGHQLEALQKISADPLRECPQCHQSGLQKLVSAASFRLKGGGWYETDFKSGDKKHLADSSDASAGTGDKTDGKSDEVVKDKKDSGKEAAKADKSKSASSGDSKPAGEGKSAGKNTKPGES